MTQCQVKTKVFLVEIWVPRLTQKVSFKGGSHLDNPKPSFFLASPISGTRFLLRVVVCNIPRFYQILGEILLLFCVHWLKIHSDLKTFWLLKNFIMKTIPNSLLILEEHLSEKPNIKILIFFLSYSNLCKLTCKGMNYKCLSKGLY
jgi:hypothetical protein